MASVIEELAKNHDASKIARLAPTSLIFGFWNSREKDHQLAIKYPRILSSIIRATNVAVLKRSAQFNPAFDPAAILNGAENTESATPSEQESREKDEKDPLSQEGLRAAPAVDTHGGVRVFGQISRQTEVNLVGLRALAVVKGDKTDEGETLKLRRYLLGLALVAGRAQESYNLRQGCSLVLKDGLPVEAKAVRPSGQRESFTLGFRCRLCLRRSSRQRLRHLRDTQQGLQFRSQAGERRAEGQGRQKSRQEKREDRLTTSQQILTMYLEVEVTFTASQYHGDEWPPSPARLFQALVAASHHRCSWPNASGGPGWCATLAGTATPPTILALPDSDRSNGQLINYVPNNDDAFGSEGHVRTDKSLAGRTIPSGASLIYAWSFEPGEDAEGQADVISAMASLVTWLGQTTDLVLAQGRLVAEPSHRPNGQRTPLVPEGAKRWRLALACAGLPAIAQGSLPPVPSAPLRPTSRTAGRSITGPGIGTAPVHSHFQTPPLSYGALTANTCRSIPPVFVKFPEWCATP